MDRTYIYLKRPIFQHPSNYIEKIKGTKLRGKTKFVMIMRGATLEGSNSNFK